MFRNCHNLVCFYLCRMQSSTAFAMDVIRRRSVQMLSAAESGFVLVLRIFPPRTSSRVPFLRHMRGASFGGRRHFGSPLPLSIRSTKPLHATTLRACITAASRDSYTTPEETLKKRFGSCSDTNMLSRRKSTVAKPDIISIQRLSKMDVAESSGHCTLCLPRISGQVSFITHTCGCSSCLFSKRKPLKSSRKTIASSLEESLSRVTIWCTSAVGPKGSAVYCDTFSLIRRQLHSCGVKESRCIFSALKISGLNTEMCMVDGADAVMAISSPLRTPQDDSDLFSHPKRDSLK